MMTWFQWSLQDALSPVMEEFCYFHDFAMLVLSMIVCLVSCLFLSILSNKMINKGLLEGQSLEVIWTSIPALILIQIAMPSLLLLYTLEDVHKVSMTLKTLGNQWFWSYEYSDFWSSSNSLSFDSYMASDISNKPRLLEVDNRVVLPYSTHIRMLISSSDVLHSWTIPALGVKADACPGRLNQVKFISHRPAVVYGQCSEICGANHSFMPICLEFTNSSVFVRWLSSMLD